MRYLSCCFALSLLFVAACTASPSGVHVEQTWARATPDGADTGAVYAVISNSGAADRLTAVETDASQAVEIHRTQIVDDIAQMRRIDGIEIPARGRVAFEPGGLHIMLTGLRQPLRENQSISLVFVFEKAGRVPAQANIAPLGSIEAPGEDAAAAHQH